MSVNLAEVLVLEASPSSQLKLLFHLLNCRLAPDAYSRGISMQWFHALLNLATGQHMLD